MPNYRLARTFPKMLVVALVAIGTGTTAIARADSTPAGDFVLALSSQRPGTPTGLTLHITYRNPSDPAAKPSAQRRIVIDLPAGTRIDGNTIAACHASDEQLMLAGPSGCPSASRVGSGTLVLRTGVALFDPYVDDVALFNGGTQLIEIFNKHGLQTTTAIGHRSYTGPSELTETPAATPGGPPDNESVVTTLDYHTDNVQGVDARAFVTTPSSCPVSRQWTSRLTYTTADGHTYHNLSTTPCAPAPAPPLPCGPATGQLGGLALGPVRLEQTRAHIRNQFRHYATRGRHDMDYFCLAKDGIRVGYPSRVLLRTLVKSERRRASGHAVLALTSNPHYALDGARPGTRLAAATRRLRSAPRFHVGLNWWYLTPGTVSHGVLKVRHGIIKEIGIADRRLTDSPRADQRFLTGFS